MLHIVCASNNWKMNHINDEYKNVFKNYQKFTEVKSLNVTTFNGTSYYKI